MALPVAILLEIAPIEEAHVGLSIKRDANGIVRVQVEFIMQKLHDQNLPKCLNPES
jgi:hypothetical protein